MKDMASGEQVTLFAPKLAARITEQTRSWNKYLWTF